MPAGNLLVRSRRNGMHLVPAWNLQQRDRWLLALCARQLFLGAWRAAVRALPGWYVRLRRRLCHAGKLLAMPAWHFRICTRIEPVMPPVPARRVLRSDWRD